MRDFDNDTDTRRGQRLAPENLRFKINGREFTVISGYAPDAPEGDALDEWRATEFEGISDKDFAALADRTVLRFLAAGQEEAWLAARDPKAENPITGLDLVDLVNHLIGAVVNRPTVPLAPSSTGSTSPPDQGQPGGTGKHLTAVSPSKAAKG